MFLHFCESAVITVVLLLQWNKSFNQENIKPPNFSPRLKKSVFWMLWGCHDFYITSSSGNLKLFYIFISMLFFSLYFFHLYHIRHSTYSKCVVSVEPANSALDIYPSTLIPHNTILALSATFTKKFVNIATIQISFPQVAFFFVGFWLFIHNNHVE